MRQVQERRARQEPDRANPRAAGVSTPEGPSPREALRGMSYREQLSKLSPRTVQGAHGDAASEPSPDGIAPLVSEGGAATGTADEAEVPVGMPLVRVGDKGVYVIKLQTVLNTLGAELDADGKFGSKTRDAVVKFQSRNKLLVDGVVGPQTWGALREQTAHDDGESVLAGSAGSAGNPLPTTLPQGPVGMYPEGDSPTGMPPGMGPWAPLLAGGPASTSGDKAPSQDGEPDYWPELEALLNQTPQGQAALKSRQDFAVKVVWMPRTANRYYPSGNTVFLDSAKPRAAAAGYFVHEMHHAKMEKTGQSVEAKPGNKDEFVAAHVKEEEDGTFLQFEMVMDLEFQGKATPGPKGIECEAEYRSAYNAGLQATKTKDPTATPAALHAAGKARGRLWIRWAIAEGRLKPFGGMLKYGEHYDREWRKTPKSP